MHVTGVKTQAPLEKEKAIEKKSQPPCARVND